MSQIFLAFVDLKAASETRKSNSNPGFDGLRTTVEIRSHLGHSSVSNFQEALDLSLNIWPYRTRTGPPQVEEPAYKNLQTLASGARF